MRKRRLIPLLLAIGCGGTATTPDAGSGWTQVSPVSTDDYFAISSAGNEVWLLGTGGVSRWDGSTLAPVATPTTDKLLALHAVGPNDVWFVGNSGAVAHWDGTAIQPIASGVATPLLSVWASSASDVWIADASPSLLHWDGTTMARATAATMALQAVSGTARDDVWATGAMGTIVHFDGATWAPVASPSAENLVYVTAIARDSAYARALPSGASLRWNGVMWASEAAIYRSTFAGTGRDDVWAAGTMLQHWDGMTWTAQAAPSLVGTISIDDDGTLWSAAAGGQLARRMPCGWEYVSGMISFGEGVVGGWSDGQEVWFIAAPGGDFLDVASCGFQRRASPDPLPQGIAGTSGSDLWIVGTAGAITHWDGVTRTFLPLPSINQVPSAIWAASPTDAWAVGVGGLIVHWDGTSWTNVASPVTRWLTAVWGASATDIWAVGEASTLLHWDGVSWSERSLDDNVWLGAIWGASGDDVWVSGELGRIWHWDGTAWSRFATGREATLHAVAGLASDDVWIVGDGGLALHWDGRVWRQDPTGVDVTLATIVVAESIWIGGGKGTLLRRAR